MKLHGMPNANFSMTYANRMQGVSHCVPCPDPSAAAGLQLSIFSHLQGKAAVWDTQSFRKKNSVGSSLQGTFATALRFQTLVTPNQAVA